MCEAQIDLAAKAAKPTADFPIFLEYQDDAYEAVERLSIADLREAMTIVSKAEREDRLDDIKKVVLAELGRRVRGPREGAVRRRCAR